MSRTIFLHNKSNHSQTFEVHGINNNRNVTVRAFQTVRLLAPDHSSGAIIAIHDGHEGEQAEFTKDGFGGNDFIDLSNIIGAGGNLTVAQTDNLSTLKGLPDFMQRLNIAWHKASQATKNSIADYVHLDSAGNVIRIDAIKDHPALEQFVRTFADGRTYIGPGSWNGNPGNPNDNKQSSAAHGNKDLIVTYSDGNAMPTPQGHRVPHVSHVSALASGSPSQTTKVDPKRPVIHNIVAGDTLWSLAQHYGLTVAEIEHANPNIDPAELHIGQAIRLVPQTIPATYTIGDSDNFPDLAAFFGVRQEQIEARNPGVDPKNLKVGQVVNLMAKSAPVHGSTSSLKGSGIILTNKSNTPCTYHFFNNIKNDGVNSVPNFNKTFTSVKLAGGRSTFVPLPSSFKGRVQRGEEIPATWAEFQLDASNDHQAHGDISVEQGNDGGAIISSTDGRHSQEGFTATAGDVQVWGPPQAYQTRQDGVRALASTMGNWIAGPNRAAIDAEQNRIGKNVYVTGGTGIPDVASRNQRLAVEFF